MGDLNSGEDPPPRPLIYKEAEEAWFWENDVKMHASYLTLLAKLHSDKWKPGGSSS